jgi:hypothetical protein
MASLPSAVPFSTRFGGCFLSVLEPAIQQPVVPQFHVPLPMYICYWVAALNSLLHWLLVQHRVRAILNRWIKAARIATSGL